MRAVVGRRGEKPVASTNTLSRFETQILSEPDNLEQLVKLNGAWVARAGEQWIKEGKYALHWTRLSCHRFVANQVRLALFVLAYNLGNFLRRLVLPDSVQHWSLRSIQVKLIKIGAKVVRHARQVIFQMTEVAVSRELFEQVLGRIWALAPGAG